MKRFLKGLMVLVLLVATFVPYIHVSAAGDRINHYTWVVNKTENETVSADTDLLEYVMSKKHDVSSGADYNDDWLSFYGEFDGVYKYPKAEDGLTFVFNREETIDGVRHLYYDIKYTEVIVTKEASEPTIQYGHNNIWATSNGQVAVLYENRDTSEQAALDGEHYVSLGHVVDYVVGDSITVKAKANEGYHFVGWYVSDVQKGAEYYYRDQLVSTNANYTYQPGVTTISGIDGTINYLTAAFEQDSSSDEPTEPTITTYTIEEGNNQTYTKGSNTNIVIKANGDLSKLEAIEIDNGNVVDPSNYELANGSTILTLKSAFLENSSVGEHTIAFRYNDGKAEAKLTIANATNNNTTPSSNNTNNPQTADNIEFYVMMLGLSIIAIGGVGIYTKKKFFS